MEVEVDKITIGSTPVIDQFRRSLIYEFWDKDNLYVAITIMNDDVLVLRKSREGVLPSVGY